MGASAYYRWLADKQNTPENFGGQVPQVNGKQALMVYSAMNKATNIGILQSATTPSKGGLVISLALATIGSDYGAEIDLSIINDDPVVALFSESNSRFIVTVKPKDKSEFENLFSNLPIFKIGKVTSGNKLIILNLASINKDCIRDSFKQTLNKI